MLSSSQHTAYSRAPRHLCDAIYMTLTVTFPPARLLLSWNDRPILVPGFQVRPEGRDAVVRYIQPADGPPGVRRARAWEMLDRYRHALLAQGWQIKLVDQPRRTPYLLCYSTSNVMSTKTEGMRDEIIHS